MNDEEFATPPQSEREFALRWARMTEEEQERFCRGLLSAIEVLQRLRVLESPDAPRDPSPA